ncbi:MAG: 3-dehydroquinate synthase [Syntrophus sp. SKADARSKE-3]|nr:3-dehydroquinate synthase [Syntrophus sp. SKADARSKE-3]
MNKLKVNLDKKSASSYEIYIGKGILDRIATMIVKGNWGARYIVVTDSNVAPLHGERVLSALRGLDLKVDLICFPAGEASKTMDTCLMLADRLMELGADRTSALIALGGGVVGDMTGFLASIFMRGIPCIQMPTSLLAQVDSSIGGKTGVDLAAGKNMLGTFYQPKAVFIDLAFLETLPEEEFSNGLAEIVKYGVIEDPELLHIMESETEAVKNRDKGVMERLITKSCRIKKGIIEIDVTEKGLRRILNFGHTIGHAIEAESDYTVSHGQGVSIGMAAAARLAESLDYLPTKERLRIETILTQVGLPRHIPGTLEKERILARIKTDKKKKGTVTPFVLLKKIGMPFVNGEVSEELIGKTIEAIQS